MKLNPVNCDLVKGMKNYKMEFIVKTTRRKELMIRIHIALFLIKIASFIANTTLSINKEDEK